MELVAVGLACNWVFRLSNGFQLPILFDPRVENAEEDAKATRAKEAHQAQLELVQEVKQLRELLQKEREEKGKE